MYCHKCGTKNVDSAKFCRNCGCLLKTEENDQYNNVKVQHKEKSKSNKKGLFITLFGVIAALVIVVIVLIGGEAPGNNKKESVVADKVESKEDKEKEKAAEIGYRIVGHKNYDENMRLEEEQKYTYNKEGCLETRETVFYDENGEVEKSGVVNYTYKKEGNRIIMEGGEDENKEKIEFEYGNNNLISITEYGDNEVFQKEEYDDNGNLIGRYVGIGALAGKFREEYEYDKNNRQTKVIRDYLDPENDDLDYCYEYVYDADGRKIAQTGYNSKDEKFGQGEVLYDSEGKIIEETWYEQESSYSSSTKYTYDENDNLIEMDFNDAYNTRVTYDYNNNNQLNLYEVYWDNEISEKCEFDMNGNVKIQKDYYEGELSSCSEYIYEKYEVEDHLYITEMEWVIDNWTFIELNSYYLSYVDYVDRGNEATY